MLSFLVQKVKTFAAIFHSLFLIILKNLRNIIIVEYFDESSYKELNSKVKSDDSIYFLDGFQNLFYENSVKDPYGNGRLSLME